MLVMLHKKIIEIDVYRHIEMSLEKHHTKLYDWDYIINMWGFMYSMGDGFNGSIR